MNESAAIVAPQELGGEPGNQSSGGPPCGIPTWVATTARTPFPTVITDPKDRPESGSN